MTMRTAPPGTRHAQRGFTLVELMIAMLLGLILSAGVIQIFISSKQSYRMQDGLARMQENARFSMDFLTREIRMAGFTGCYNDGPGSIENILNDQTNYGWNINNLLQGHEATTSSSWSPALDASLVGSVLAETDVIAIRRMASNGVKLTSPYSDSAQLFIDPTNNIFSTGDIVMVTDCTQGSIFQVTNLQSAGGKIDVVHSSSGGYTPGNSGPHLGNSYGEDAEVASLQTTIFFIGQGASGEPALFRRTLGTSGGSTATLSNEELIEGVENMQILYGEDTDDDGSANKYVAADSATMDNVMSIRLSLLMRTTEDNLASEPQTYTYNGSTVTATDKRIRRVFDTTVKLRNRGTK